MAAMELDSVYQLKYLCKDFYRKKQLMSQCLLETLDALSNERPVVLQMKRRHFNTDVAGDKKASLEWMRINAERERIYRFKSIAKETATQYYIIMERFTQLLLSSGKNKRQELDQVTGGSQTIGESGEMHIDGEDKTTSKDRDGASVTNMREQSMTNGGASTTSRKHDSKQSSPELKRVMNFAYRENLLHNMVRFICDYLR